MDWGYFIAGLGGAVFIDVMKVITARRRVVRETSALAKAQFDLLIAQGQIESYVATIDRLRAELRKANGGAA